MRSTDRKGTLHEKIFPINKNIDDYLAHAFLEVWIDNELIFKGLSCLCTSPWLL